MDHVVTQETADTVKALQDVHAKWVEEQFDTKDERIRTLEDALRPFANSTGHVEGEAWVPGPGPGICVECSCPWPCKYETARRGIGG